MSEQVSPKDVREAINAARDAIQRQQRSFTYTTAILTSLVTNFDFTKARVRQVDIGPMIDAVQREGWHLEGLDYSTLKGPEKDGLGVKTASSQIQALMFFTRQ